MTSSSGRWTAPKGCIDPGRSAQETATIEALEEAGVIGVVVGAELGVYVDVNSASEVREIRAFALRVDRVLDHWQEEASRRRQWMSIPEAKAALQNRGLGSLLDKLAKQHERPRR